MEINKEKLNFPGIYVIKNIINGKIYVGKSKNCYKRLYQHLSDIKIENRNYNENIHLLNSFKKYGEDKFECFIIEKFDFNLKNLEQLLAERELYWMKELDSLNKEKGYNLRWDSEGKCFCSQETKEKISKRLKNEWDSGIRKQHSEKMKEYWDNNDSRKKQQSEIMSKVKTKYHYIIYSPDGELISKNGTYQMLKDYGLTNSLNSFSRKKCDEVFCKKYKVIRVKNNEDIVRPSKKLGD